MSTMLTGLRASPAIFDVSECSFVAVQDAKSSLHTRLLSNLVLSLAHEKTKPLHDLWLSLSTTVASCQSLVL